jgi:hypothetical protein
LEIKSALSENLYFHSFESSRQYRSIRGRDCSSLWKTTAFLYFHIYQQQRMGKLKSEFRQIANLLKKILVYMNTHSPHVLDESARRRRRLTGPSLSVRVASHGPAGKPAAQPNHDVTPRWPLGRARVRSATTTRRLGSLAPAYGKGKHINYRSNELMLRTPVSLQVFELFLSSRPATSLTTASARAARCCCAARSPPCPGDWLGTLSAPESR